MTKSIGDVASDLSYIQIDTISVVERAHHHVLWTRLPQYTPDDIDEALNKNNGVFEYWSHAAAYLPMEAWRYTLIPKQDRLDGANLWFDRDEETILKVLERVEKEGPLSASDFEAKIRVGANGWWNWKPAKKALEQLFLEGRLMIAFRKGFKKYYDIPQRVLPEGIDTSTPSENEYFEHVTQRALKAHGIVSLNGICHNRPRLKEPVQKVLNDLMDNQSVLKVAIEGVDSTDFYVRPSDLEEAGTAVKNRSLRILSPFDNVAIQRQRLKDIFDFDYLFECYVPKEKRKYGYFSLPMVVRDRFVGMIDCKAHRKDKVLEVKSCHFTEPGLSNAQKKDRYLEPLSKALTKFAKFNNCNDVHLGTGD